MEPTIEKLCPHCNKNFELQHVEHNGMLKASIANFEDCTHCGTRNDHWIKINWPLEPCCTTCEKTLTADEIKYFEGTCNDCESKVDWSN